MKRWLSVLAVGLMFTACDLSPAAAASPAPAAGPRIVVRNGGKPGAVELVAQAKVELDANLIVEEQGKDGRWEPLIDLDLGSMKLVETCGQSVGACVSLDAGRTFRPVPWSGMSCASQCNGSCKKNVYRAGTPHRFVVKTCDGKERFEGPPFNLPLDPAK